MILLLILFIFQKMNISYNQNLFLKKILNPLLYFYIKKNNILIILYFHNMLNQFLHLIFLLIKLIFFIFLYFYMQILNHLMNLKIQMVCLN